MSAKVPAAMESAAEPSQLPCASLLVPGDMVELCGLESAAEHNGCLATVQSYDEGQERYAVHCVDRKGALIKLNVCPANAVLWRTPPALEAEGHAARVVDALSLLAQQWPALAAAFSARGLPELASALRGIGKSIVTPIDHADLSWFASTKAGQQRYVFKKPGSERAILEAYGSPDSIARALEYQAQKPQELEKAAAWHRDFEHGGPEVWSAYAGAN